MIGRNKVVPGLLAILSAGLMACEINPSSQVQPHDVMAATAAITTSAECSVGVPGDETYCTETCPCSIGEGDCDSSNQCLDGLKCHFNVGADYGYAADVDVCACPAADDVGKSSFCSDLCPCSEGQADCDADGECQTGLTCYSNVGEHYGFDAGDDVCATCLPPEALHSIDFCNPDCTCGEGEGDCDTDADCDAGLECFLNVGTDYGLDPDADVCAACPPPSKLGSSSFCSAGCTCSEGEGDCDSDAECDAGLSCFSDTGGDFGLDPETDVCAVCPPPSKLGSSSFCSEACPCSEGEGDCDITDECQTGLVCADDAGPQYGLGASVDVCVSLG